MKSTSFFLLLGFLLLTCRTDPAETPSNDKKPNHLIHEKSPYLLQHAYNPVDWYPWGEEAFAKARNEDKPIFLSIGYSTCHWCHVMERESYDDPEVARLLNDAFVAIKVDREERPDIDNIYMTVCQMLTGSGGWPLNIVMTPDKKPFFAATYIPKENRFGHSGLLELIPKLKQLWHEQREKAVNSANQITAFLQQQQESASAADLGAATLDSAYQELAKRFDERDGGFGNAPKFPSPHQLLFLLRCWKRTGNPKALEMTERTLQKMRMGGIYDHIGFGFHRYSTDSRWLAPHFEKMLYDQAMLAMAYTEAYQATHKEQYRQTATQILTYALRSMSSPDGAFYSAEDADSEGKEGKFYVWTETEIRQALAKEDAELLISVYGISREGNFGGEASEGESGKNILHLERSILEIAQEMKLSEKTILNRLESARTKLFALREKRVHPFKDDKVLADWNGLMITALAKAGQVFGDAAYLNAARRAADFVLQKMRKPDGQLLHRYRGGEASLPAPVDDYAFLIWGLIEIYEGTFDLRYLQAGIDLNRYLTKHFWDGKNGGFYFTADNAESLLIRSKELYDGATPSGNSVAAFNLLRLGRMTGNPELERQAAQMERVFARSIQQAPSGYTQFLIAVDYAVGPSYEVVIAGNSTANDTRAMLTALQSRFVPNKVILLRPTEVESPEIARLAQFTKYQKALQGKATAYVCLNYLCKAPTTSTQRMLELLK